MPGDESDDEISLEEADIQALARSSLKLGERILDTSAGGGNEDIVRDARGVLDKPMILQKLKDIKYKIPDGAKRVPWIDTLVIEDSAELPKGIGAKDGVKLESAFAVIATTAAREAYRRLKVMKVPCSRPTDFYAEMFRSDSTMYKVRARASEETRRIHIVEDRKKSQAAKKFAKKARTKKLEQRAAEKRQTLDDISNWRQKKKGDKSTDDADLEAILNRHGLRKDGVAADKGKGKGNLGKPTKSKKRAAIDKKFGYGGKKRFSKSNTRESTSDYSSHPSERKKGGKGKGFGKGKGGFGSSRKRGR